MSNTKDKAIGLDAENINTRPDLQVKTRPIKGVANRPVGAFVLKNGKPVPDLKDPSMKAREEQRLKESKSKE